ncbi:MAG TPA: DUF4349 domain-containing protein [Candidatus Bathyarchaeia archaeon]|nr:DUF4349 domain-containing protein [Candidatus Bathyarchaeia archaeon]
MNTIHPVAPEEVMSLLDGELSAAEGQAISAHIENCAECSTLTQQFRGTSQALSGWRVPAVPAKLEQSFRDWADKTRLGVKTGPPGLFVRASFWTWKHGLLGIGSATVTLIFLFGLATVNYRRSRSDEFGALEQYARISSTTRSGTNSYNPELPAGDLRAAVTNKSSVPGKSGGFDKLVGQPIADQKSKVFTNKIQTLTSTGAAPDSNGLFHGLGDHAQNSFSGDGLPGPMIARIVSVSIVVKDFAAARSSVDAILARHHGYSAQLNVATPENAPRSIQASLRIPATELSSAVADLKTLGRVENESQSGEEVTQQHSDLVARLKNSRDTEQRFRAILQQRTGNVVEVLQVEEGIARVRGDIERMEAEQKALEHRVAFTAVELQLTEEYKAQLNPPAPSVSIRIHNSLVAGYHNLSETILGILLFFAEYGLTLLLWLVILALPVILLRRRYGKALAAV